MYTRVKQCIEKFVHLLLLYTEMILMKVGKIKLQKLFKEIVTYIYTGYI